MSIFKNPDFLVLEPLDLENKLFLPTSKLYTQTLWQLNSLYRDVKAALSQFQSVVAREAQRFYEHPVDTATAWWGNVADYSTRLYASITDRMLPRVEAIYHEVVTDTAEFGHRSGALWQAFYENPETFTASLIASISTRFNSMISNSEAYISSSLEVFNSYLVGFYTAMVDLFNLLLAQPGAALTALYQNTLAALLDVYYELISSLLSWL